MNKNPQSPYPYKHIFGPVPSRRLGYSLGIDLIPFKTCTFDCCYCQLGLTTHKTQERKEFYPLQEILAEVEKKLQENIPLDYLTLSGSGEPTLYSRLQELITEIKKMTSVPLAVLTNSSLLYLEDVRQALSQADLIIPSLDAGFEESYQKINRPCPALNFETILHGLEKFCARYSSKIWLEIFLIAGINDSKAELEQIKILIEKWQPARVQLNTVLRPPAESTAKAVSLPKMQKIARFLGSKTEIIADFDKLKLDGLQTINRKEILNLLQRRPCTLNDISGALNLHQNEILKYLEELAAAGLIEWNKTSQKPFYQITKQSQKH